MFHSLGRTVLPGGGVDHRAGFAGKLAITLFVALYADAGAADVDVLTLADAVALASQEHPQSAAFASQEQAALESARAERELPDPKLAFAVENLPVTGDDAFGFGREDMTMVTVGVMQDVVTRDKRAAASARMSAEAGRLAAERALSERTIRREAALAWLDAFEAQRRAATLRKLLVEMTAERGIDVARISPGTAQSSEVLALDIELSSARDDLILAERDEARARAALSRWIGEAAARSLPEALPHSLGADMDLAAAARDIDAHPAMEAAQRAVDVALRDVDRARAERKPNWSWRLMYGQRKDDRSDLASFQVTVDLPWDRANRQDRRIAGRLAEARSMRSTLSDRRLMLEAELATIKADLVASDERLREHEEQRLPVARARFDASRARYAGGDGALMEVWRARRAWIETDLHHDMILTDRARAIARLAWLTGDGEDLQ